MLLFDAPATNNMVVIFILVQDAHPLLRRTQGNGNGKGNNGNGNGNANGRRRPLKQPCVVLLSDKQYEDKHDEDQPMECELQGDDLDGKSYQMVTLKNLPPGFAKNHGLESGRSTLFVHGGEIDDDTHELNVPGGAEVAVSIHFL